MDDDLLGDAARQLLYEQCTPAVVRSIESGDRQQAGRLWRLIEDSGFAHAMVPEVHGGSELGLRQVAGLLYQCGAHALPLPLGDTLIGRALLAQAGAARPAGPLALAEGERLDDGSVRAVVHGGWAADCALVCAAGVWHVLPLDCAQRRPHLFVLDCVAHWDAGRLDDAPALPVGLPAGLDLRTLQANMLAAQMAGALGAAFELTLRYANERQQFGRPIGKFQAIQHQLAVMSQHVFAAHIASRLGCASDAAFPHRLPAATAKARCSQAALEVAQAAHAIHGAIGVTEAYDLQLFTRRLHAWRLAFGSESYWHTVAGEALLEHGGMSLDLVRAITDAVPAAAGAEPTGPACGSM
ncbi:acyl-CoA dehydrogenase [Verticiella sediminum]|uniref:Acyl-CoA dehydrogenase n=1 Tax=Verticiella sediminum TaxID=1247510 RepID=A0A556AV26_9BURK|nr:acyl-CoA dehydrogenase family protein [Verticiella sediminum]TSH96809.1 acyl-CoA dehydrogenase [Verticiella sediminum]